MELAAAICDRTIVMYAGQVVEARARRHRRDRRLGRHRGQAGLYRGGGR